MTIRYSILIIVLLNLGLMSGQISGGSFNGDKSYLPNVTPPSPESFNMTKYGNINVNEFYGKTAISIPLYTYKSGMLELSLSINHDGCGVKVDDLSNLTGSNWSLNTGGIITRTVYDLTDEKAPYRQYIQNLNNFINQYNTADGSIGATQLSNFIKDDQTDSEVDIFNYSVPGYSGSFYLDENFLPKLTKLDNEIKIEANGNFVQTKEFIITTPNGVKYYFGGNNGTEITSIRLNPLSAGITTFFLTRIVHPIQGQIYFEYTNVASTLINLSKQYDITFLDKIMWPDMIAEGFASMDFLESACPQHFGEITNELNVKTNTLNLSQHKYLSKIYSDLSNSSIFFNTTSITNNVNIDRFLNSIEVKTTGNDFIYKVNFDYYQQKNSNIVQRIFLTNIYINKDLQNSNLTNKKYQEYKFIYKSPENLPKRLSNSQDFIGFYNDKNSNQSLISNTPPTIENEDSLDEQLSINDNLLNDTRFGDRTPNFDFATIGILTDIYYPTGGHTHFDYESNPAKKKKYKEYSSDYNSNGVESVNTVYETQIVNFEMIVDSNFSEDQNNNPCHFAIGQIKITDTTPGASIEPILLTRNVYSGEGNYSIQFIKNHVYKIEILPSTNSSCPVEVRYLCVIFDGFEKTDGTGIRLKRQTDYSTLNDTFPTIKSYYYTKPEELNAPIENLPYLKVPNYIHEFIKNKILNLEQCSTFFGASQFILDYYEIQALYKIFSSNSYNNYFFDSEGQAYPDVMISYGGDNFENGGVYKTFNKIVNNPPVFIESFSERKYSIGQSFNDFLFKKSNDNIISGDLIKEISFKKDHLNFYKLTETNYTYNVNITDYVYNLVGKEVFNYAINTHPFNTTLTNLVYGAYDVKTFKKEISTKSTKDFFDLVPLTIEDDTPYKKLTTTQTYEYGSLKGLPAKITTTTSDSSITKTIRNHYANEFNSLSGLNSNQRDALSNLVHENRIATPVQVEHYQNDELLSTQRTIYKDYGALHILPELIQTSKGANALEDRVIFDEYDAKGNPTVVLLKDGTKTKYFYNALNQVVLKVENYTAALNIPEIPDLSHPCDFMNQYPNTMMSVYNYDSVTNQITSIVSSNCQTVYYTYDALHQLKWIKDNEGNIIQEFDHNYKH